MDSKEITKQYKLWLENAKEDPDLVKEMASWEAEEQIEEVTSFLFFLLTSASIITLSA